MERFLNVPIIMTHTVDIFMSRISNDFKLLTFAINENFVSIYIFQNYEKKLFSYYL